ncbi:hypothetical protein RHMOL_Rhmol04G0295200 [Rhododendron molle]|uniref:Uncharacterized protein n=1 Tax=Rhododendron molle TaxID=49168 RepID=A0ACC0P6V2_RHOML|nr:hypothetical protein RHMOL_Rhmol04G0295200 [Rhododendron molle]
MTKSILFWNPLTGETKRVSDPPTRIFRFSNCRTYGLGYDSFADDYKLVWINLGFEDIETGVPEPNEVGVFSLRTNSWRRIQDFPTTKLCSHEPGVFINGALYWTGFSKDSANHRYKVVSFCLEKEKYTLLDIPAIDFPLRIFYIGIQVLGDKLAVYYPSNVDGSYHLFFLNLCDHGESWTKHTVTLPNRKWFDPLCLLENVEEVLFQGRGGELGVYRLTDGIFRKFEEPNKLNVGRLLQLTNAEYTRKDVLETEEQILKEVSWMLYSPTVHTLLSIFVAAARHNCRFFDFKLECLSRQSSYLLELSLLDCSYME